MMNIDRLILDVLKRGELNAYEIGVYLEEQTGRSMSALPFFNHLARLVKSGLIDDRWVGDSDVKKYRLVKKD